MFRQRPNASRTRQPPGTGPRTATQPVLWPVRSSTLFGTGCVREVRPTLSSSRTAVPTTLPDGLSRGTRPWWERTLPLCPFPERQSGLPMLIDIPFKDVCCLVQTGQFLGRGLPVSGASKADRSTTPCAPSQPRPSEQGRVAVPRHEHPLSGVFAIEPPVWSEHRPIGRDEGRCDAQDGATDLHGGLKLRAGPFGWKHLLARDLAPEFADFFA
jgi:hypothetical protein